MHTILLWCPLAVQRYLSNVYRYVWWLLVQIFIFTSRASWTLLFNDYLRRVFRKRDQQVLLHIVDVGVVDGLILDNQALVLLEQ